MSIRSPFVVPFERQAVSRVETRDLSSSNVELTRRGPIADPVEVARTLKRGGLWLRQARLALNRIVADEPVSVVLEADVDEVVAAIEALNLHARIS